MTPCRAVLATAVAFAGLQCCVGSGSSSPSTTTDVDQDDFAWQNNPLQWHQQAARIVDVRFSTMDNLEVFAKNAKQAGVSVLMLVAINNITSCPGPWYNGLQLCEHINGTYPIVDGTLERWQKLVADIKPMRMMWWMNPTYWSTQGSVWKHATADHSSDVGKWFSWGATKQDECWGHNPDGAQGSWGSTGAKSGIMSGLASFCSESYASYMVDAMANTWTKGLGIDGYTLDCSANYGKGACGTRGMLQCPNGDGLTGWSKIMKGVRDAQPQVVQSGEGYGNWQELMTADANMGGQGFGKLHTATQTAILTGDVSGVESQARVTGADAAAVLCHLHPFYDGKQPGGCPTMYFRDSTATLRDPVQYRMWVALEASAGVISEHDYDPNSYCFEAKTTTSSTYNGCFEDSNPGAWWNVTNDPHTDTESPLWAFGKYRALNRLALRTNLDVKVSRGSAPTPGPSNYKTYEGQNSYNGHGGTDIDRSPKKHLTPAQCQQRCDEDAQCQCVTFQKGGNCWKRGACNPAAFENDAATKDFTVYLNENKPPPGNGGAIAYLKHDSMGPNGDAAIVVFNPGSAANVTIDLSMLPSSFFGGASSNGAVVPYDLLTMKKDNPPLAESWTIPMEAKEMKFFAGFSLGVFAPRQGKKANCKADDQYSKKAVGKTLQACNLECYADSKCENIFIEYVDMTYSGLTAAAPDVVCTLLGSLKDPSTGCSEGTGTLVRKLPGARSCADEWQDVGETLPRAKGAPAMQPGPPSSKCKNQQAALLML